MRIHLDEIDVLGMEEQYGAVTKVTRGALVTEMSTYTRQQGGAYRALQEVFDHPDMPQPGHGLSDVVPGNLGILNRLGHLRLSGRIPKMHKRDKRTCRVDLIYESLLAGNNQDLTNSNPLNTFYGRHRSSLVQKKTNQYYLQGDRSIPPLELFVEHTYQRNDGENRPGVHLKQGGEIDVFEPQKNYKFGGYLNTLFPWVIEEALLGAVNLTPWLNRVAYTWMCTEVVYSMLKYGKYLFEFEFQSNEDLWMPEIVFIDERTGRPPVGLIDTIGRKRIAYYRPLNFNLAFNATFEGWGVLA